MKNARLQMVLGGCFIGLAFGYKLPQLASHSTKCAFWAGMFLGLYQLAGIECRQWWPKSLPRIFLGCSSMTMLVLSGWYSLELQTVKLSAVMFGYIAGILGVGIIVTIVIIVVTLCDNFKKT